MALILRFDGTGVGEDEFIEWLNTEVWHSGLKGIKWEVIDETLQADQDQGRREP